MKIVVRKAEPKEAKALTELTFCSKRYWEYPEEYMKIWEEELTVTEEYIAGNVVYAADAGGKLAGYYSILHRHEDQWSGETFVGMGFWLDNLFIHPAFIGKGIGTALMNHAKVICRDIGCSTLSVFSDPHSRGFYEKQGFRFVRDCPSSIPGRTIPMLKLLMEE